MTIPDYQSVMKPLLRFTADKLEHSLREAVDSLAIEFRLTQDELKELLPSGQQFVFVNRVGWARTYLKKAGLLESTRRSHFQITPRGMDVLNQAPDRIDVKYLDQFDEFKEFRNLKRTRLEEAVTDDLSDNTPEEALETAYKQLRDTLANDLLLQLKGSSPSLFEKIVVELLVKMGYGGSRNDAGKAIGRSGDEGIDGIIKEDRLGLDIIYIQAKRWDGTVGRPEVQKFAGALQGQLARKGIMITTSAFSKEANEYASRIENKIVLIDGEQIAQLMIDHGLGVSPVAIFEVKKLDSDYFSEQ
ncbi:MAG: restriction system protein [bacterium]|nr:MAG: restriction system protein [bacterium]KAF0147712.1 MAG: restriction system protein [bacterium]KAF0166798.1 MAG: restriction system protein [bacterium]TXT22854.1 MAG: restriction system protein [bacterium]